LHELTTGAVIPADSQPRTPIGPSVARGRVALDWPLDCDQTAEMMRVVHRAMKWLRATRSKLSLAVFDRDGARLINEVRNQGLTYLPPAALIDLRKRIRNIERSGVQGRLIEAGCALGGSAIVIAATKAEQRPLYVYDVFGMIPTPSARDGQDVLDRYQEIASGRAQGLAGAEYYGYRDDLLAEVVASFTRFGLEPPPHEVHLVQGLFEDTIHPDGPVAFAHIDGDWYESVRVCLERIWPHLVVGGVLVIDDYEHWSGCRTAVDEFLGARGGWRTEQHARLHIVKTT
jgi:hypothetical protein